MDPQNSEIKLRVTASREEFDIAILNAQKAVDAFFDCTARQEKLSDAAVALRTMRLYEKLVAALKAKIAHMEGT